MGSATTISRPAYIDGEQHDRFAFGSHLLGPPRQFIRRDADFAERKVAERDGTTIDGPGDTLSGDGLEVPGFDQGKIECLGALNNCRRQRMFAAALDARCGPQKSFRPTAPSYD